MIELTTGNLLEAHVDALVNTVNCVGVMGKGIALQFREAEPQNYRYYQAACREGRVRLGQMLVFDKGETFHPRYIINFPTKQHWRDRSHLKDVASGLEVLIREVERRGIRSIAVPPLGCGNGGLRWDDVRPLIEAAFSRLEGVRVLLYAPVALPHAETKLTAKKPELTVAEAVLLSLIANYAEQMYRLTTLDVQALAYFAQASGQPLNLKFSQEQYGPYAAGLHLMLKRLEGHYLCGYSLRSDNRDIQLMPGAIEAAARSLTGAAAEQRLAKVKQLIQGFETPYGLELLASVHWVTEKIDREAMRDPELAISAVHSWSERKAKFPPEHVRAAWQRLRGEGWLANGQLSEEFQMELTLS